LQAALSVRTREAFPAQWLATQSDLAAAYGIRFRGQRDDNVERAIALYEEVLTADIREALPHDRAITRYNLAFAYSIRIRGKRADNLRRAVTLLEEALTVYTREAMPRGHLLTSQGLGWTLMIMRDWGRASGVLADARKTFLLLYGQGLDETEAGDLIETAGPLFTNAAYAAAELGDAEQAFDLACEGKARLLATALRLQTLDLAPAQRQRLGELQTAIREQSRLLDQSTGTTRGEVLGRLAQLRSELSGLIGAASNGISS
jgi:hypothetical protein